MQQDTDQWLEQYAARLKELEADVKTIENWRIEHMSECHPKILDWQSSMWGNWLKVTGIFGAATLVLGFVLGQLFPILERWLGK